MNLCTVKFPPHVTVTGRPGQVIEPGPDGSVTLHDVPREKAVKFAFMNGATVTDVTSGRVLSAPAPVLSDARPQASEDTLRELRDRVDKLSAVVQEQQSLIDTQQKLLDGSTIAKTDDTTAAKTDDTTAAKTDDTTAAKKPRSRSTK